MTAIGPFLPRIVEGLLTTFWLAWASIALAAFVAVILGALRVSRSPLTSAASGVGVELMRGTSVLVQLFWVYYALPVLPGGIDLGPTTAALLVLGINGGAYGADIVRAGLLAVPRAQGDATRALGLPPLVAFWRVTLPQALAQIVPSFGSLAIDIAKWTSVVSFVGVTDVLYWANVARSSTNEVVLVYGIVALLYIGLSIVVAGSFRGLEALLPTSRARRAARRSRPRAVSV